MWSDVEEAETVRVPVVPGVVAVIGLGGVGLPLALQCAARGWRVLGCDIDARIVEAVKSGRTPLYAEADLESELPALVERGLLTATLNTAEAVARANVVLVTVPLQGIESQARFQDLDAVTETIGHALQYGTLVSYESALPVGTTAGRLRSKLESCSGLDASRSFYLAASPTRVSAGHVLRDLRALPKIVGGFDARSVQAATAFYRSILPIEVVSVASPTEAEFVKLIETIYSDVNLALANELACYADEHGLDVRTALAAANTRNFVHVQQPGVGLSSATLPVYPYLLATDAHPDELANEQGAIQHLDLARKARQINDGMAEYAVQRIEAAAGSLWHRSVLLLGAACLADVREVAFSSTYLLQAALWRRGATVYVDDPLYGPADLHALGFQSLSSGRENEIDAIILQTAHRAYQSFDFRRFARCRILLDGRNALERAQVEEAGLRYMALGDGIEDAARCVVAVREDVRSC
ncbi:MAG TPA: nucleotide sugar dehydrogenase [Ktedonobacteraceae bacterium]